MNADKYFQNYDFKEIFNKILKEKQIGYSDNLDRHMAELRILSDQLRQTYKTKDYFRSFPTLDDNFSCYVQILNTPFVEVAKREKFIKFLEKKTLSKLKDRIREYIFPYEDSDKDKLNDSALLILRFDSFEEAKMVAEVLNGVQIDKSHKALAYNYLDFQRIFNSNAKDEEEKINKVELVKKMEWEKSGLIEMILLKNPQNVSINKLHFLQKSFDEVMKINSEEIETCKWSPQGKYLMSLEHGAIKLYNENGQVENKINVHARNFILSNDERYMITFIGYMQDTKPWTKLEDLKDKKEEDKKVEAKKEASENVKKEEETKKEEKKKEEEEAKKEEKKTEEEIDKKENVLIRDLHLNEIIRGLSITKEETFDNFKWSSNSEYFGRLKKDVLIIYEAPKMQIIMDPTIKKRHPVKEGISSYEWFPNRNILIAISHKRNEKVITQTLLNFIEIPSRKTYPQSSLVDLEIISLEWHKNNSILAVLCKTTKKNNFSIRIFDFNFESYLYRSSHTNLPEPTGGIKHYNSMQIKWMENELFIVPKFKEANLDHLSVFPYHLEKNSLKLIPWGADRSLTKLLHSDFIPSKNGSHFLLANLDVNNSNSYGKVDLYAIFENKINFCKGMELGKGVSRISWDEGGRLFYTELTNAKDKEGLRIFNSEGNQVYQVKDESLISASWRPRHIPLTDLAENCEDISKNLKTLKNQYIEEDSEFLSEIDKNRREMEKKMKGAFTKVTDKRKAKWNEQHENNQKIDLKTMEHEFWIEKILKSEEILQNSGDF